MRVFQLLPGFTTGDAISEYTVELDSIIKELGYESSILTVEKHTSMDARRLCYDYKNYQDKIAAGDVIIYHFSVGSELTDFFRRVKAKKILIYHNITPPHYFTNINIQTAKDLMKGIEEVHGLKDYADLALGVSEYDRQDLEKIGFKNTGRLWLLLSNKRDDKRVNESIVKKYSDGFINILSVGRMCPNKKFEDVIKSFYFYKNTIQKNSRLFIVGSITGGSIYVEFLRGFCAQLGLWDVVFTGHINDNDLNSYYKVSDVFITMSEHEGFCVPLLEAMYFGVPIIAYGSTAIPETLGDAGICVYDKDYSSIAELIDIICKNGSKRKEIVEKQKLRLKDFSRDNLRDLLKDFINNLK